MRRFFNTRSKRMAELIEIANNQIKLKFEDNGEIAVIKPAIFNRWYKEDKENSIDIEIGTTSISVTRENMEEMINKYPEIAPIVRRKFSVSMVGHEFKKLKVGIKNDKIKKLVEIYNINGEQFEITEYLEGRWKGWITGVEVHGERYKNLKKAFDSLQWNEIMLKEFMEYRKMTHDESKAM